MTPTETKRKTFVITPTPAAVNPTVARWLWLLDDTRERTLKSLAGMTDAEVNWMPPDGSNNIGTLLYHMVLIELDWLYAEILEQPDGPAEIGTLLPHNARNEDGQLTTVNHETVQDHLQRLAAGRHLLTTALQTMREDEFYRVRHLDTYDVTPEWVLH
ncbi:MAG: DinB family protein, partial [Caldilineaceae bacterium]|nr:DinB family protein [Caldilineaceae bacterium]